MLSDLVSQQFCWLTFSHWITNSANCGRASHTNEKQGTAVLFASQKPGCLLWFQTQPSSSATHSSNVIVKYADDTTVIGLITDNDEMAYREEVSTLTKWCQENHLSLNIDKTKELVVDYRRQSREHTPIDKTPQGSRVRPIWSHVRPNFSRVRLTKIPGRTGASSHSRKEKKVSATQKLCGSTKDTPVRLLSWSKPIRDSEGRTPPLIGRSPDIPVCVCAH